MSTREDGMALAPLVLALEERRAFRQVILRTPSSAGREDVLADLGVRAPLRLIAGGHGTRAERIAYLLIAFERVLTRERAGVAVVGGDGDEALALALAAVKAGVLVARLGAGLRTWDWGVPEEINRVLADRMGDTLLTDCPQAVDNLLEEGIVDSRIHTVGSTVVDALRRCEPAARARAAWSRLGLHAGQYVLVLLQGWGGLDEHHRLAALADAIAAMSRRAPVVVPVPLQRRARLVTGTPAGQAPQVVWLDPPGFLDLLSLQLGAGAIVTDAGSVQAEASALEIPCFTLSDATERTATLTHGTNMLLGDDPAGLAIVELDGQPAARTSIPLWDGRAAQRAADVLMANYALRE